MSFELIIPPMKTIFTISTSSHLFKSFALRDFLAIFGYSLKILLVDGNAEDITDADVLLLQEIQSELVDKIKQKYKSQPDKLRWALKPAVAIYLLENGFEKVIYIDNDIYFFQSPEFLFEKLEQSDFLLTPHFYPSDSTKNQNWLEANFRVGLYNAGFIGVSQKGIPILDWWANCCLYNVKKAYWRGLFDDQKYLDLVPVLFDEVEILKHKGCNLAGWNYQNYQLSRDEEHQLLVNGDPLVFIHFAALSLQEFSSKESPLNPEFEIYLSALKKLNPAFDGHVSKFESRNLRSFLYFLRWRLMRLLEKKR